MRRSFFIVIFLLGPAWTPPAPAALDIGPFTSCRVALANQLPPLTGEGIPFAAELEQLRPGKRGFALLPTKGLFPLSLVEPMFRQLQLPLFAAYRGDERGELSSTVAQNDQAFMAVYGMWLAELISLALPDERVFLREVRYRANSATEFAGTPRAYEWHTDNAYFTANIPLLGTGTECRDEDGAYSAERGQTLILGGEAREREVGAPAVWHRGVLRPEPRWVVTLIYDRRPTAGE